MGPSLQAAPSPKKELTLPPNFYVSTFADNIKNPRQLAQGDKGTIFVGSLRAGKVYALVDQNQDGKADRVYVIAEKLKYPNGVAFHNGALYVAEVDKISKYPNIEKQLAKPPKPIIVKDNLPKRRHHGARVIKFGPDGWLYMTIGMPCNICLMKNHLYGTIVRMQADGSNMQTYAYGIRNSVGFDWAPWDNALWFTDNGRDWLGDHLPPDELNRAPQIGLNFGFPYVYGDNVPDPKYKQLRHAKNFSIPSYNLPAHVAALGMVFYTGKQFPKDYQNQILIAEHGSWNRSKRVGYRLSLITLEDNQVKSYKPFITGWLKSGWKISGRPVDLLVLKDGSLLVSDDHTNKIYRVNYSIPTS